MSEPIPFRNTVVVANAGSGKTYTLVQYYIFALLDRGGDPSPPLPHELLALTFTEKAAGEMAVRVADKLMQMVRGEIDEALLQRLGKANLPEERKLKKLISQIMSAPITTFHSFCAQLVRENAFILGIPPYFRIALENEEEELMNEIAEQIILKGLEDRKVPWRSAVVRLGLKGVISALIRLYRQVGEQGMALNEVPTASLFSPEKVKELGSKIARLIAEMREDTRLSPKSADKLRIIQKKYQHLQVAMEQPSWNEPHLADAFSELREAAGGQFGNSELRKALVLKIVELGGQLVNYFQAPEEKGWIILLNQLEEALEKEKKLRAVLSFSDLLKKARILLRSNLEVRQRYKKRFRRIFVDEFQDTSPLQEDIMACLAESLEHNQELHEGERASMKLTLGSDRLFIVGDPKQSIYGFRGANAQLFESVREKISREGNELVLSVCRRCAEPITQIVNEIAFSTLLLGKDGVKLSEADRMSALSPQKGQAGGIGLVELNDSLDPLQTLSKGLSKGIQNLLAQGYLPSDIAVLFRRIRGASYLLHELQQSGIPAQLEGGEGFFSRSEVMDFIAALRISLVPEDEIATLTVLRSPFVRMTDSELVLLLDGLEKWEKGYNFLMVREAYKKAGISLDTQNRLAHLIRISDDIKSYLHNRLLPWAVGKLLEEGGYFTSQDGRALRQAKANIEKLAVFSLEEWEDPFRLVHRLWQYVYEPPREALAPMEEKGVLGVRLMTIHQSKGLEFPVVIVADTMAVQPSETSPALFDPEIGIGVNYRSRPIAACAPKTTEEKEAAQTGIDRVRRRQRERGESELARLLYVATTRAKEAFFFTLGVKEGEPLLTRGLSLQTLFQQARTQNSLVFDELLSCQNWG